MSKKHFIELADMIREHNNRNPFNRQEFTPDQIATLAEFCKSQNSAFMRDRWIAYINGECGKNGGKVKVAA
jgi:hypothetical protein